MITPEQYAEWPEPLVRLMQQLEEYILSDICRRLSGQKWERFTSTAYQQAASLIEFNGMDLREISRKIARMTGLLEEDVERLFQATYENAVKDVGYAYGKLGKPSRLAESEEIRQVLRAQARQTANTYRNLTSSMGFTVKSGGHVSFLPIGAAYRDSLDFVQMQITSGAVSPNVAIKNAVDRLAASGLRTVEYSSGRTEQMDVAVRRATVTGMGQITGHIAEEQMKELDTDLVEVSAHGGARDQGSGPRNHKSWQGKIYSMSGRSKKYPSLREVTGYGSAEGLKGPNCRHDFSPFLDGVMRPIWSEEALRTIDKPPVAYQGRTYSMYEAAQYQRRMEVSMRALKRKLLSYDAAGLKEEFTTASGLLSAQRREYLKFSQAMGLRSQVERAEVAGFGRSIAARASAAGRRKTK